MSVSFEADQTYHGRVEPHFGVGVQNDQAAGGLCDGLREMLVAPSRRCAAGLGGVAVAHAAVVHAAAVHAAAVAGPVAALHPYAD